MHGAHLFLRGIFPSSHISSMNSVFNDVLEVTHQLFPSLEQLSRQAAVTHFQRSYENIKTCAPLTNLDENGLQDRSYWKNGQAKKGVT